MRIHRPQRRRVWVKYHIGGHRALTDVSPTSQDIRCRAPISNGESSGWASHAEGGNVSQAPRENTLGPKKNEKWREGIFYDVLREPEAMV